MKDKYYTPEIEEFHVGFEYERCDDGYNWIKDTYPRAAEHIRLKNLIPYTRVKYLDREDIESLGWVYKETSDGGFDYYWDKHTMRHSILYSEKSKRTVITLWDRSRLEDHTAFIGKIKNKSELKKVLKMIGYEG